MDPHQLRVLDELRVLDTERAKVLGKEFRRKFKVERSYALGGAASSWRKLPAAGSHSFQRADALVAGTSFLRHNSATAVASTELTALRCGKHAHCGKWHSSAQLSVYQIAQLANN